MKKSNKLLKFSLSFVRMWNLVNTSEFSKISNFVRISDLARVSNLVVSSEIFTI